MPLDDHYSLLYGPRYDIFIGNIHFESWADIEKLYWVIFVRMLWRLSQFILPTDKVSSSVSNGNVVEWRLPVSDLSAGGLEMLERPVEFSKGDLTDRGSREDIHVPYDGFDQPRMARWGIRNAEDKLLIAFSDSLREEVVNLERVEIELPHVADVPLRTRNISRFLVC